VTTPAKIVKTVLEPVESPAIDAQDILPTDNEALELAEQELTSTQSALDTVDAENDRLHAKLRATEAALLDLWANVTDASDVKPETIDFIIGLEAEVAARQPAPKFTRK
jgi:hypothetical protein